METDSSWYCCARPFSNEGLYRSVMELFFPLSTTGKITSIVASKDPSKQPLSSQLLQSKAQAQDQYDRT